MAQVWIYSWPIVCVRECYADKIFELDGLLEKKTSFRYEGFRGLSYSWLGDQCAISNVAEDEAAAGGEVAGSVG